MFSGTILSGKKSFRKMYIIRIEKHFWDFFVIRGRTKADQQYHFGRGTVEIFEIEDFSNFAPWIFAKFPIRGERTNLMTFLIRYDFPPIFGKDPTPWIRLWSGRCIEMRGRLYLSNSSKMTRYLIKIKIHFLSVPSYSCFYKALNIFNFLIFFFEIFCIWLLTF